jgi:hypothetical protein
VCIKRLEKKCLKLWALVVKKQAGNVCEMKSIGTPCFGLSKAHYIENYKLNKSLRFSRINGIYCCQHHKSFITLFRYMSAERPDDLKYLIEHYQDKVEIDRYFLENKIDVFTVWLQRDKETNEINETQEEVNR